MTDYWSARQGRGPRHSIDLPAAIAMFAAVIRYAYQKDWFQEQFGFYCVDRLEVPGGAGDTIEHTILFDVGRADVWPPTDTSSYDEDTLFDLIEWTHDHISSGVERPGEYHPFSDCGWHFSEFTLEPARTDYRQRINRILTRYDTGYELGENGRIRHTPSDVTRPVVDAARAELPNVTDATLRTEIRASIDKYYMRNATPTDRRDAIRDLAGVLERLRPMAKQHLARKDEVALFEIANKFGVRHNNVDQLTDFDTDIWWEWMFHIYLTTALALIKVSNPPPLSEPTSASDSTSDDDSPF